MGLPAQKRSKTSKRTRASHFALARKKADACSHCSAPVLPHRACLACGYYKAREILKIKVKKDKKKK